MATAATRLRNFLLSQATLSNVGSRIYETKPAQNQGWPFIVLRRVSTENADVLNGSVGDAPLFYGFSIECVSDKEVTANAVGDAVRTALHLYRGTFDDTTAKGCFVDSESLDINRFDDGSDDGAFARTLETRIFL